MIWLLQIPAPLLGFVTVALVVGCPSADCSCSEKRCRTLESRANDVSGQVFQLAGVLYAVLVAFVVVWEQFGDAENATQAEASAIADLLRDSTAIPAAYRPEVQRSLVAYTEDVINDELPRMRRGETIEEESDHTTELWTAFLKVQPESRNEIAFFDRDIVKLNSRSLGSCGWGRSDGGFEGFVMYLIFALEHPFVGALSVKPDPYVNVLQIWKDDLPHA